MLILGPASSQVLVRKLVSSLIGFSEFFLRFAGCVLAPPYQLLRVSLPLLSSCWLSRLFAVSCSPVEPDRLSQGIGLSRPEQWRISGHTLPLWVAIQYFKTTIKVTLRSYLLRDFSTLWTPCHSKSAETGSLGTSQFFRNTLNEWNSWQNRDNLPMQLPVTISLTRKPHPTAA